MNALENVEVLEQSTEYKEWKKSHKDSYLVHIFKIIDDASGDVWQLGYYNKGKDTITSFYIEGSTVEQAEDSKVFKEDKKIIKKLDLDQATMDFSKVVEQAKNFQQEHHRNDTPLKTIAILQNLDVGQVWNITFVTKTFKTLNVKIDANVGKVVKHSFNSIFEFRK